MVQGRSFGGCGFFTWFDPPICSRSKAIIPGLLRRINRHEEEIESLEAKLRGSASARARILKFNCLCRVVVILVILLVVIVVVCCNCNLKCIGGGQVVKRLPIA